MILMSSILSEIIVSVISSVFTAAITGFVAWLIIKGNYRKINFANKMKDFGFLQTVSVAEVSSSEKRQIYLNSDEIKFIYVSGNGYFKNNISNLRKALAKGTEIKVLLARPNNQFLTDIETIEKNNGIRSMETFINSEVYDIHMLIENINKDFPNNPIQVRYFSSEYRLPLMITKKKINEESMLTKGWLTVTLPPYKSTKHFVLRGKYIDNEEEPNSNNEINFIYMMDQHFDAIWDVSLSWEKVQDNPKA